MAKKEQELLEKIVELLIPISVKAKYEVDLINEAYAKDRLLAKFKAEKAKEAKDDSKDKS